LKLSKLLRDAHGGAFQIFKSRRKFFMKIMKRLLALGLVGTMVIGGSLTAFATDPTGASGTAITGTGTAANLNVDQVVYSVTVPTNAAMTAALSYKVDPQLLAYQKGDATDKAGVLFKNGSGSEAKYSGKSDSLKIVSKSSIPISIKIEPKLTAATAASGEFVYAGGQSTTEDFSGTNDGTKGLYLGLHSTNEVAKALDTTALDYTNLLYSAKDLFEVSGTVDAGYTYAIPSTVTEGFPEYEFYLTGAINPDVATTTWMTYGTDNVTVKERAAVPTIELKYTPTAEYTVKKDCVAQWNNDYSISVWKSSGTKAEGGFGSTVTVTVNGKTCTGATVSDKGTINIPWESIAKAYDATYTADKYGDELNTANVAVIVTNGSEADKYYGVAK
jgi:hypothetical protein